MREYARKTDESFARLFEFGPYDALPMSAKASVPGLAALASLLEPLLKAAPHGVIGRASLTAAFAQILAARGFSPRSLAAQAQLAAGRALIALAHLRKLCQQPAVRAQRSKRASAQQISTLQSLADLYRPDWSGPLPRTPAALARPADKRIAGAMLSAKVAGNCSAARAAYAGGICRGAACALQTPP